MTLHRHFLRAACVVGVVVLASGLSAHTLAANAAAQTVVVGTGNPDVDVPAVQAAVDRGGEVILKGHFSFRRDPAVTIATALLPWGYPPNATILVSKAVAISGTLDGNDEIATIEGGRLPSMLKLQALASRFRDCALSTRRPGRFLSMRSTA